MTTTFAVEGALEAVAGRLVVDEGGGLLDVVEETDSVVRDGVVVEGSDDVLVSAEIEVELPGDEVLVEIETLPITAPP